MSVRRSSVGVGVLKNFLYAIGGYDGASRQCLSSVERYDAVRNEWHSVAEMTVKRSGAGVGVLGMLVHIGRCHFMKSLKEIIWILWYLYSEKVQLKQPLLFSIPK